MKLYRELGIASLGELEAAARADRLAKVKGLGPALQRKILEGIEMREGAPGARHLHRAAELLAAAAKELANSGLGLTRITAAGDFRRCSELVFDLALVARSAAARQRPRGAEDGRHDRHAHRRRAFRSLPPPRHRVGSPHPGDPRPGGKRPAWRSAPMASGAATRSSRRATKRRSTGRSASRSSRPSSARVAARWSSPAASRLPTLVEEKDMRGILHAHTVASDGADTLAEMAAGDAGARLRLFRRRRPFAVGGLCRRAQHRRGRRAARGDR